MTTYGSLINQDTSWMMRLMHVVKIISGSKQMAWSSLTNIGRYATLRVLTSTDDAIMDQLIGCVAEINHTRFINNVLAPGIDVEKTQSVIYVPT